MAMEFANLYVYVCTWDLRFFTTCNLTHAAGTTYIGRETIFKAIVIASDLFSDKSA